MTYVPGIRRKAVKRKSNELSEHDEQVRVVVYLHKLGKLVHSTPNAGKRNPRLGKWLKDEGMAAGVPDLFIPMPCNGKPGLYIEMKVRAGGSVSDLQAWWLEQLQKQGYVACVCKGHEQAIAVINEYFGIE
jgi:hypothetical protein